ncbi:hypothetical protein HC776_03005 [bacterium]|nr:hypothetical protein [bacterium]
MLSRPRDRVAFVRDHLLFTTLMLIATHDEALILSAGDGVIVVMSRSHVLISIMCRFTSPTISSLRHCCTV